MAELLKNNFYKDNPKQWMNIVLDLPLLFIVNFSFLFLKEFSMVGVEYYSGFWSSLIKFSVVPLAILNTIFCYFAVLIGYRLKNSMSSLCLFSLVFCGLYFILTFFLSVVFFGYSGYAMILSDAKLNSLFDYAYFLLAPIFILAVGACLYNLKQLKKIKAKSDSEFSAANMKVMFADIVIIFCLCYAFVISKEFITVWLEVRSFDNVIENFDKLMTLGFYVSLVSFITIYPIFLTTYRICKSTKWFCILSWSSFFLIILVFQKEGSWQAPLEILINPRSIMALLATALLMQKSYRQ